MSWMGVLKSSMWNEFTYKIKNDMFPTDLKEYIVYSKLMRDNKKAVDWYLEKGKSASSQEKKKLFRLILGEMRRENNFNYWMTDQSNKAMLKSRGNWLIPHNPSEWANIFMSDENVDRFIAEWEKKKDWKPMQGSLGRAARFVSKSKGFFFQAIGDVFNFDRTKRMQKRREWEQRYEKLKPIFAEIIAKDENNLYGAAKSRKGMTDKFQLEVESILSEDTLTLGDWVNLENRINEHYSDPPEREEDDTEERFAKKLKRWRYHRNLSLKRLAEDIGDELILKHNLPTQTEEQPFPNVYALLSTKGFREGTTDEKTYQQAYQVDYDVADITLEKAKKYLDEYSSIRKVNENDQKYSTDLLKLKKDGKASGFPLLSKLQIYAPKGMVNWTNKAFRKLLDTNQSLTEHEQWNQLKLEVESKLRFNEEAMKQSWLEESWQMANSDSYKPTTANQGVKPLTRTKGAETTKEQYINRLSNALVEDSSYQQNLKDYIQAKKEGLQQFTESVPKMLVDFVGHVNAELLGGKQQASYKEALEEALGPERAEEYITLIGGEMASRNHGFRQVGSASLGVGGENVAVYSIPQGGQKLQTEFITNLTDVLIDGREIEGYEDFELFWVDFKEGKETEDISTRLGGYATTVSPYQDITSLITNETDKVLAEYVYTSYLEDSDMLEYAKRGMKRTMGSGDYYIDEFIRMMFAAEESFVAKMGSGGKILEAIEAAQEEIDKADKSEKMQYLMKKVQEGKVPFLKEIRDLRTAMEGSIPKIKKGLEEQVKKNLERIVKNKRRAKSEIPWLLQDLVADGFIKLKKEVKSDG
tara:strand:+ start:229 stop:2664 length:2436 start_codon:yes stop_codon:yes gene_type:complete